MKQPAAQPWRPFAEIVTERKSELGVSFREIERRTKQLDDRRGLSAAHMVRLFHGNEDPVPRAISLIARALAMAPEDFLEHHLHQMRSCLDERLDFQTAAANFELAKAKQYEPVAPRRAYRTPVVRGRRRYGVPTTSLRETTLSVSRRSHVGDLRGRPASAPGFPRSAIGDRWIGASAPHSASVACPSPVR